jgi:hypothetical protein
VRGLASRFAAAPPQADGAPPMDHSQMDHSKSDKSGDKK